MATGFDVHFPDCRAASFGLHAALSNVAVGAHRDVKLAAVGAGNQAFGPVVVDGAAWQVQHLDGRGADAGLPRLIGEAHHRICCGDVKVGTD